MWVVISMGMGLTAATVVIHAVGTTLWIQRLRGHEAREKTSLSGANWRLLALLIQTSLVILSLHMLEVVVWAAAFWFAPQVPQLDSFEDAVYFSSVTFTTLGYGDIVLQQKWRLLAGMEAMVGIIHFGWSTALIFSVVQRLIRLHLVQSGDHQS